jgi:hypothetical protein
MGWSEWWLLIAPGVLFVVGFISLWCTLREIRQRKLAAKKIDWETLEHELSNAIRHKDAASVLRLTQPLHEAAMTGPDGEARTSA